MALDATSRISGPALKTAFAGPDQSAWAVLAALRFFLAMVVVLGHCCSLIGGRHDWTYFGLWLNQGSAVFGFFILSGYSIAASLQRDPQHFYRRRFVRIWPLYLGCILFGLLVSLRLPHGFTWPQGGHEGPVSLISVIASLLMLQTIIAAPLAITGQIWSLSPEWWHYMAAPGLKKLSSFSLITFLTISFFAFLIIAPPPGGGAEGFTHGLGLLTLSWLWLTGFVFHRLQSRPAGAAILIFPSVFALYFNHFTGVPLFIAIFTLLLSNEFELPSPLRRAGNFLGDVSYPLYLFHMPVIAFLLSCGVKTTAPMVATSLLVATVALMAVDYPCRKLCRDPRPRRPAPAAGIEHRQSV